MALTETFYDNQTIGADDLNNIAIDLGNSTFANFDDTTTYNVDALNGITQSLVDKGVLYTGNKLQPTLQSDGTVKIDTGICVFESGAKKRVTTPIVITPEQNKLQYIYFYNNVALNKVELIVSDTNPETENIDFVIIGKLTSIGKLLDKRAIACAKVANLGTNIYDDTKSIVVPAYDGVSTAQMVTISTSFANSAKYKYLYIWTANQDKSDMAGTKGALCDLSTGKFIGYGNSQESGIDLTVGNKKEYVSAVLLGGNFIYLKCGNLTPFASTPAQTIYYKFM